MDKTARNTLWFAQKPSTNIFWRFNMKKIPILSMLFFLAALSLTACSSTQAADKITIHTENGSIQNFKSKEAVLTETKDVAKLQNELEKVDSEVKNSSQTDLVGATEYLIEMYKDDHLDAIYSLYGDTLTYYSDPTNNKVKIYELSSKQQKLLQEMLDDYLD